MPFQLNYRDYLANNSGGSEAGGLLSPDQWAQLDPQQQAGLVNFQGLGTAIGRNDSRYADLASKTGVEQNRPINIGSGILDPNMRDQKGNLIVKDPSKVYQGDGYYALGADNYTPGYQAGVADSGIFHGDKWDVAKMAAFLGLAAAGGGAFSGAGAGEAGAVSGAATPSDAYWGMTADAGNVATDAGAADGGGGLLSQDLGAGGGLDPETWAGNGGMGVAQNGIGPGTWQNIAQGTLNNPSSLLGRAGDVAGNLGSWAISHPLQAYGAVQTVGGLLGSHGGGGSTSSNSSNANKGGTGAGVGDGYKAERPSYTPNPFLIQQLRQAGYSV